MTDFHGPFEYYIVRFVGWTGCMQQISDKVIRLSGYSRVLFQITAGFSVQVCSCELYSCVFDIYRAYMCCNMFKNCS